jgi:hypothetical protein
VELFNIFDKRHECYPSLVEIQYQKKWKMLSNLLLPDEFRKTKKCEPYQLMNHFICVEIDKKIYCVWDIILNGGNVILSLALLKKVDYGRNRYGDRITKYQLASEFEEDDREISLEELASLNPKGYQELMSRCKAILHEVNTKQIAY